MIKKECIVCKKESSDGIIVNREFICSCCESKIVNSSVDTDFYNYYVSCIKKAMKSFDYKQLSL